MIFIEFLQAFILPSVFIFVLFITGLILIFAKKKKPGLVLLIISISFYYFFSITPVSNLILMPLERQYNYPSHEEIEKTNIIVVLSGGVKNKNLSLPSVFGDSTLFRLNEAFKIYSIKEDKPHIIVSGTSPINKYSKEALFGASFLELYGVPKEKVSFELFSADTFEHAEELEKTIGEKEFMLVTSAYHLPRAVETFRKAGLNPIPVPADYQMGGDFVLLDFIPQPHNLRKSNLAFHEYFGILYYRLFK
ncbi:MAG: ElyC/SanA/YdcF family protein [Candidatus Pacebacteria bacterium]|nr:ElyC/SanA/YdcF family protein [Candidatus Paceibacterota bacterium]